ncbi:hypothetical protein [Pseudomonas sp. EL_65y_Pfl1_R32]|uniref:hypothetical protein n=1 Tax=Pseudomonas sp. EL_65y_Pfl1_R32 TaxID=3088696 RepID=UPI0030D7FC40
MAIIVSNVRFCAEKQNLPNGCFGSNAAIQPLRIKLGPSKPGDAQYKTSQKTTFGHLKALRHPANTHNSYGLAIVSNSKFVDGEFTLY